MSLEIAFSQSSMGIGGAETVCVLNPKDPTDSENFDRFADLKPYLDSLGLTSEDLNNLVSGYFEDVENPLYEELEYDGVKEEVEVRIANIGEKTIEVAHCKREEGGKEIPSSFDMQLRQSNLGYKILVVLDGVGYFIAPNKVKPMGEIYGSGMGMSGTWMEKGSVALISSPSAWSIVETKNDFEYVYISYPRFDPNIDTQAIVAVQ